MLQQLPWIMIEILSYIMVYHFLGLADKNLGYAFLVFLSYQVVYRVRVAFQNAMMVRELYKAKQELKGSESEK